MNTATSRRAMLGAIAALPVLSLPASAGSDHDAALLAVAPRLLPLLDRYDELWAQHAGTYEPGLAEVQQLIRNRGLQWDEAERASPLWQRYLAARRPADDVGQVIDEMIEPFWDCPPSTVLGLLIVARIAASFDQWEGVVFENVRSAVKASALCD